jgi:hypothetical protein
LNLFGIFLSSTRYLNGIDMDPYRFISGEKEEVIRKLISKRKEIDGEVESSSSKRVRTQTDDVGYTRTFGFFFIYSLSVFNLKIIMTPI